MIALLAAVALAALPPADVIYTDGPILSMVEGQPAPEALAVRNGRIAAVGKKSEVMKLARPGDEGGRPGQARAPPRLHRPPLPLPGRGRRRRLGQRLAPAGRSGDVHPRHPGRAPQAGGPPEGQARGLGHRLRLRLHRPRREAGHHPARHRRGLPREPGDAPARLRPRRGLRLEGARSSCRSGRTRPPRPGGSSSASREATSRPGW